MSRNGWIWSTKWVSYSATSEQRKFSKFWTLFLLLLWENLSMQLVSNGYVRKAMQFHPDLPNYNIFATTGKCCFHLVLNRNIYVSRLLTVRSYRCQKSTRNVNIICKRWTEPIPFSSILNWGESICPQNLRQKLCKTPKILVQTIESIENPRALFK